MHSLHVLDGCSTSLLRDAARLFKSLAGEEEDLEFNQKGDDVRSVSRLAVAL